MTNRREMLLQTMAVLAAGVTSSPSHAESVIVDASEANAMGVTFSEVTYPPLTVREGLGLNLNIPAPPAEHPRVCFRKQDLPALRAKTNTSFLKVKNAWIEIKNAALIGSDGKLPTPILGTPSNFDLAVLLSVEAQALMYVLDGNLAMGQRAVQAIFNLHKTVVFNLKKGDVTRDFGRLILSTALIYDWCYDLISPTDKRRLIARIETWGTQMEFNWPRQTQNGISGHGAEAQLSRDMLAAGIAIYDEKPTIYNYGAGRLYAELLPAREFFYKGSFQPQGSSYGGYRHKWELITTLLLTRMGAPASISKTQGQVSYQWIYSRRSDGQFLRNGDDFIEMFHSHGKRWPIYSAAYAASIYSDPILMNEAVLEGPRDKDPLFDFLFIDPNVKPNGDLTSLPLTRFFDEPYGAMTARTGWDENSVVAEMKIGTYYFAGHHHLDAGNFQIYYKGPLAINSGIYDGVNGQYGSAHHINFYQRTIAHNCMLVMDQSEKFTWHSKRVVNDGGQRYPRGAVEPEYMDVLLTDEYRIGHLISHGFGPDAAKPNYTFIKGDITKSYTAKVKQHTRSFVFLNLGRSDVPAALIVLDRVESADKDFKKTWLLHCVEEPKIDGIRSTIKRSGKGYSGKLVNLSLLPAVNNLSITKVGGEGKEFTVQGENFAQAFRPEYENNSADGAQWRLEISPKTASTKDMFLNVIQVMDDDNQIQPLPVQYLENDTLLGICIANRQVYFSHKEGLIGTPVNFSVVAADTTQIVVTDLENGTWKLFKENDRTTAIAEQSTEQHHLYFELGKGAYVLSRA
jgi:Heparinase II C-terminal domain/Heparinase II/III-like protein